jgi:flagellar assembly protein FliH
MDMIYLGRLGAGELVLKGPRLPAAAARALERAEALVDVARDEADRIRAEAHEKGFASGLAQGQKDLAALLCEAHAKADKHVRDLEPVIVDCIVRGVRALVGDIEPSHIIERAILQVHERLGDAAGLVLRVPPARGDEAQDVVDALAEDHNMLLPIRIVVDSSLVDDDCVVESPLGRAEVRLESQLERLREAVEKALASVELKA